MQIDHRTGILKVDVSSIIPSYLWVLTAENISKLSPVVHFREAWQCVDCEIQLFTYVADSSNDGHPQEISTWKNQTRQTS